MRLSTLLVILGAAALSAPAFAAPDTVMPDATGNAVVTVQANPGQRHALRRGDVDDVVGNYDLSNGQTLRVSYEKRRLFAETGGNKTEIVPAGERSFVSNNDDMTLVFDRVPFATSVAITRK
ncbi:MAG: hypothetical protein JWR56_757 [Massilia sp.]|nr:hypothetical protein [Massilia sp.]